MPILDRSPWGWNGPARGLLIALAGSLALGLAWSSREDRAGPVALPSLVVDANSAPAPVLMALPGIGPALSGRIVEARRSSGFGSIQDFDRRVKGIGPAKVAALRPFLRFDPVDESKPPFQP
jgi:competence protein ComEA